MYLGHVKVLLGMFLSLKTLYRKRTVIWPFYFYTIIRTLSYYAKLHLSSQSVLIETAKNILNINKLVPIYINPKTILFPLKHKRAPIQIYINAHYIVGMTAIENSTLIHFQEGIQLEVDEPFSLVSKKCHESLALKHFIENTISN
ncbi:competence protein ComK [Staphylococcus aureus]|uniref:competence protein ComK n=1 Tax=Staphylococcus aureus TaxID=1280 RepID=UPI0026EF0288|nr:competence protein ComK [Staphylococcus aureus]MDO7018732.1 competence protein ComK [Staphylococcus aureus]